MALFSQIHSSKSKKPLDNSCWTSQIPLKMKFSSENNLGEPRHYKLTVYIKYYHKSSKSSITALLPSVAHKVTSLTPQSELNLSVSLIYISPLN